MAKYILENISNIGINTLFGAIGPRCSLEVPSQEYGYKKAESMPKHLRFFIEVELEKETSPAPEKTPKKFAKKGGKNVRSDTGGLQKPVSEELSIPSNMA